MHEDFSRAEEVKAASERSFGLVFAGFFLLVAFTPLFHHLHETVRWWAFGVSVLFAALALFWQSPLKPLNRLWMRLGRLLFYVISPLTLSLLFYLAAQPSPHFLK